MSNEFVQQGKRPVSRKTAPGFIFHGDRLVGFGSPDFAVMETDRQIVWHIVRGFHYSGTVNVGSAVHLGIYMPGLVGVLQFGTGQNPGRGGSVVKDTQKGQWMELDRMWLSDAAPRNSESRALSYAFTYLRRARPRLAWVQSFADERCGKYGVVYQAANFVYCGSHMGVFYEIDGQMVHSVHFTVKNGRRIRSPKTQWAKANAHRAIKRRLRQFRYIYFLKPSFRKRLLKPVLSYPKASQLSGEHHGSTVEGRVSSSETLQFFPDKSESL
jgi:hypothetical protein